ncbi:MAG: alginate O-acetyltransferase AlgX-related protein [Candidatus Methylomirabilales bacterium]
MLILAGINLGLFWRLSVLRVSYRQLTRRFSGRPLISIAILILSVVLLIDFIAGFPGAPSDWVNLALGMGILIQAEGLRRESGQFSGHLALCACSLMLTVILVELMFVHFVVDSRTPKTEGEFLRLMTSDVVRKHNSAWPQPISVAKPAGTFRILGLSDSFGTAGGRTSNYHYLLEDLLRRNVAPTIQMVNISVPGYDTILELDILRRFGMPYSPDLVLHGFFAGNDFALFGHATEVYSYLSIVVNRNLDTLRYRPRNFLVRNWIESALGVLQEEWRRQNELKRGIGDSVGSYAKSSFLKLQFGRMNRWAKRTDQDVERMKKVFPVLDAIRAAAEAGGARYVMVIHPDETQIDDKLRQDIITTFQVSEDEYDFDLPQKMLRLYCIDRGIPCLDLLPSFRAKAKDGDLYLVRDTHYNHAGNELAAARIAQFLHGRTLLPNIHRTTPEQTQSAQ